LGKIDKERVLVNGDRHSRFFQQTMKARKTRSKIMKLKDTSGVWVDEASHIESMLVNKFTTRFKTAHTSSPNIQLDMANLISADDNDNLLQPVTDLEIKDAIFQIDKFKSPGPDGFGVAFFKNHWNNFKDEVCTAIRSFFEEGKLLRQINHTLIALIPKVNNPSTTNHFQPISLCNTIYKITSKRPILERIIDPIQSAFVPKCSIHDNILLTYEIMNKFKNIKGKKAWVALKLDMEKAYDRVEWQFLFHALHKLGFHSKWIELLKACISTVSYSVIVNDNVCGFFSSTKGIRQGDPLYPYLFIICMEVLTRMLRKAIVGRKCGIGIKISPKASKIPCLLFADDSLLFC